MWNKCQYMGFSSEGLVTSMLTATVVGADNGVEPCPLRTTDTVASNIEADIVVLTAWKLFWRAFIKLLSSGCDGRGSCLWKLTG